MDHNITLKFQSDSKEVKKDINEIKQLIARTDKSMTLPNYKELAKTLGQLERSSQKIGMNLGGAAKTLTSAVKDLVQKDFQQLMTKTDQYSQILIRTRQKIDTLDKQGRIDEANHARGKEARLMKRMNVNATAAQEAFDVLGSIGADKAQQPTSGAGRTPLGVPMAPPAGVPRKLTNGQKFGLGVGAAALEVLQAAPSLYSNPYTFNAQVNAPQVQRNSSAYRGDFTDYILEAKYGMMSKAYSEGKTAARIGLASDVGGSVGRGAVTGLQTGMMTGTPQAGLIAGIGTAATGAAISGIGYGLQGGGSAKQAQAAEDFIAKMKASTSFASFYQKALATGPRNLNAMRGLGIGEGELGQEFKQASNEFMGQDDFLQSTNAFRNVVGSRAATGSAKVSAEIGNALGISQEQLMPTQLALSTIDKRGAAGGRAFFSGQKALGFKDPAMEQALAEGATGVASQAGGQVNVDTFRNFITQGLTPGFSTATPESQMRQMQGAVEAMNLGQKEANAGGVSQFLQAKVAGKFAGADIGKAMVIQQELSNNLAGVQSGESPILEKMGYSKQQIKKMGQEFTGFQDAQLQAITKGKDATQAGIIRAAASGERPSIEGATAAETQRGAVRRGQAGKFAKGATGKRVNEYGAGGARANLNEAMTTANDALNRTRAGAAVKGGPLGEQLEQEQIEKTLSGDTMQAGTELGLNATANNPKTQNPTRNASKDIDKSMDRFIKALDLAADNINSKFGRAHG